MVQLDLADTKIVSQDAVNKVPRTYGKMKIPKLDFHDPSAFYSTLLSFFALEIFGFS